MLQLWQHTSQSLAQVTMVLKEPPTRENGLLATEPKEPQCGKVNQGSQKKSFQATLREWELTLNTRLVSGICMSGVKRLLWVQSGPDCTTANCNDWHALQWCRGIQHEECAVHSCTEATTGQQEPHHREIWPRKRRRSR